MKAKEKKSKAEIPFDPVLFAARVPSRKPTPKDLEDIKKHENDLIEPKEYEGMDEMLDAHDLSSHGRLQARTLVPPV